MRAIVDGEPIELASPPKLSKQHNHSISVVVDRLVVRAEDRGRLTDSLETALRLADGIVEVVRHDDRSATQLFSERYGCPTCGISLPELEPRQFSFNSPFGACPRCGGLGTQHEVSRRAHPRRREHLDPRGRDPAVGRAERLSAEDDSSRAREAVQVRSQRAVGRAPGEDARAASSTAPSGKKTKFRVEAGATRGDFESAWEGVLANVQRRYDETDVRLACAMELEEFMIEAPCPDVSAGGASSPSRSQSRSTS